MPAVGLKETDEKIGFLKFIYLFIYFINKYVSNKVGSRIERKKKHCTFRRGRCREGVEAAPAPAEA